MRVIIALQQLAASKEIMLLDAQVITLKPEQSVEWALKEMCKSRKIEYNLTVKEFSFGDDDAAFFNSKKMCCAFSTVVKEYKPFALHDQVIKSPFVLYGDPHFASMNLAKTAVQWFNHKQERWLTSLGIVDDAYLPVGAAIAI